MSDPRIVRVNVTNRLRWALAAASAGDWRKAEDHTRQALAELAIDWQDQPARVDRAA